MRYKLTDESNVINAWYMHLTLIVVSANDIWSGTTNGLCRSGYQLDLRLIWCSLQKQGRRF